MAAELASSRGSLSPGSLDEARLTLSEFAAGESSSRPYPREVVWSGPPSEALIMTRLLDEPTIEPAALRPRNTSAGDRHDPR